MKNQKGFSLIELLIVVVIIGIIAAIAIPNLLAARRSANEGSAQSTSRTLHSAQVTFQSTSGAGDFAASLPVLRDANLIDATLGANLVSAKSGYNFSTERSLRTPTQPAEFAVTSNPVQPAGGITQSGTRSFCVATDGVVWNYVPAPGATVPAATMGAAAPNNMVCTQTGGTPVE